MTSSSSGEGPVGSAARRSSSSSTPAAIPVAVVSSADKGEYCIGLGAAGYIDRTGFDHWGIPPHWTDAPGQKEWTAAARAFGGKIWEAVGGRRSPAIVFEHPGEDTIPTSISSVTREGWSSSAPERADTRPWSTSGTTGCARNGCRGRTARTIRRRRPTTISCATARSTLAWARCSAFSELGQVHQQMAEGRMSFGNAAILIGAPPPGWASGADPEPGLSGGRRRVRPCPRFGAPLRAEHLDANADAEVLAEHALDGGAGSRDPRSEPAGSHWT